MPPRLRPAVPSDRSWVDELRRSVYADLIERTFGGWDESRHVRHCEACWDHGGISILEREGQQGDGVRIGLLQLAETDEAIEVLEIQIEPAHQGRGIGRGLLRDVMGSASESGRDVVLSVPHKNTDAQRLYAALGFAVEGKTESHLQMRWKAEDATA